LRWLLVVVLSASTAYADDAYVLDHLDSRWWLSGQLNVIAQGQPGFPAPYVGANSLRPGDHFEVSFVATVYGGVELTPTTAIVITGESAGGNGLSDALGLAGFTNLDVVRNPSLGASPYIGRAFIDQIVPLSPLEAHDRDPLHVLRKLPARRIEVHAGKLSTADIFDVNNVGTDSHLQFMNWSVDNNGAYDYAADTRGYTLGAIVEYIDPLWAVRFGELLMPTVANGIDYDFDIANARGENLEVELHDCIAGHPGIVRVLGFANHAKMGRYSDAIAMGGVPDITATRVAGRVKYGVGLNAEQDLGAVRVFGRLGWSEGHYESFAYTEIDNTIELGGDAQLGPGKLGIALVSNGLSDDHRHYLELGGKGFLLGDGQLHYGRESIAEAYYTALAYRGASVAADLQLIARPGYNRDRGPVAVGSLRFHLEL